MLCASVPASPCEPNPCQNGGSCIKGNRRFRCTCPDGYNGKFCEAGKDLKKESQPCLFLWWDVVTDVTVTYWLWLNAFEFVDVVYSYFGFWAHWPHRLLTHTSCLAPNDCYAGNGETYRGVVSMTETGKQCLDWHSYFILAKGEDPFVLYSDFKGLEKNNHCRYSQNIISVSVTCIPYCMSMNFSASLLRYRKVQFILLFVNFRNPDGDEKPWCFYKDQNKLDWEYCKIKKCAEG